MSSPHKESGKASSIPVCLIADRGYLPGLLCTLRSLLRCSASPGRYRFHIISEDLQANDLSEIPGQSQILFHKPAAKQFNLFPALKGNHQTYLKFLLPHIIPEPEFIYLDADFICLLGLEEFWDHRSGNAPVEACPDPIGMLHPAALAKHPGIPEKTPTPYFNAGLLLLRSIPFRSKATKATLQHLLANYRLPHHDQTLLNLLFGSHWTKRDPKFNAILSPSSLADITRSIPDCNIHYAWPVKPWQNPRRAFHVPNEIYRMAMNLPLSSRFDFLLFQGQVLLRSIGYLLPNPIKAFSSFRTLASQTARSFTKFKII